MFLMIFVVTSHDVSTGLNYHHVMTGSVLLSSIAEGKCTKLKRNVHSCNTSDEHYHLIWCEELIKHKFPQFASPNLETSCLLEIGDLSRKLRLRCGCQFPWCALAFTARTYWRQPVTLTHSVNVRWGTGLCSQQARGSFHWESDKI
jgi:hypothetical protein